MGVGVRVRVRGSSPRTPLSPSSTITRTSAAEEAIERATATAPLSIVEECYAAWNCRDTKAASECFATKFTYDDGQFLGTIRNDKSRLAKHFETGARLLPPDSVLVLDSIAVCPTTNNIGTRWHVEETDGTVVPRTRGCSFYTVDSESGLIASGFRVSEMVLKPSKTFSNGLVSSASRFTTAAGGATTTTTTTSTSDALASASRTTTVAPTTTTTTTTTITPSSSSSSLSIIETYFRAWNKRDMEAALDCFVEDCVYETEDPVFVDIFKGKEALREHLLNNAAALPEACKIVLDDLATDDARGTVGVKWHLEANGIPIPSLRGCSMYTMEKKKNGNGNGDDDDNNNSNNNNNLGLLKTGFDVTEAPVKIPEAAQGVLASIVGPSTTRLFGLFQ